MNLNTPVQYVKGVGPKKAKLFNKLGVYIVEDLLNHFPRDWVLPTGVKKINELEIGKESIVIGVITSMRYINTGRIPRMIATIRDDTGECQVVWFNGGYLHSVLKVGKRIMLFGKVT
jgi:ATP-dependent DNA helicase RecG